MQNKPTIPPQTDQKATIDFQKYIYTKKSVQNSLKCWKSFN